MKSRRPPPYDLPVQPKPDRLMRIGRREKLTDIARRPRYVLAITIGLCLAPFLYQCGWYVGGCERPATTQAAR